MKKISQVTLVTILCILVGFSLLGCSPGGKAPKATPDTHSSDNAGNSAAGQEGNNPMDNGPTGQEENTPAGSGAGGQDAVEGELQQWDGVKARILTENYPEEISKYLEENRAKETQQAFNVNNRTYLVLTMGQQSSAGYGIELQELKLGDGTLTAVVSYQKPAKDAIVATVITYPSLVIETDDIYEGHYLIEYDIQR
ncbi:MAG: protease complex subunit PrcB family protein [Desulfitobacteriia bacterium]|jgi:hypothetical protein